VKRVRRVISASANVGSINAWTEDTPIMHIFFGLFLRSPEAATHVILSAIFDNFLPGSYIDAVRVPHDLFNYENKYFATHLKAFPEVTKETIRRMKKIGFSWYAEILKSKPLIVPIMHRSGGININLVAQRLWEVVDGIIAPYDVKNMVGEANNTSDVK
jgi:hypothetical protein